VSAAEYPEELGWELVTMTVYDRNAVYAVMRRR
jgi:hypothetical protein